MNRREFIKLGAGSLSALTIGCGGRAPGMLAAPAGRIIIPDMVFSNRAETWTFQNGWGDLTWIDIRPDGEGKAVWHYRKNAARAYWTPGAGGAELWFKLERDASGRWYSTGGRISFPEGAPWDRPAPVPREFDYAVEGDPGMPRPYLILAESGFEVNTTFPDDPGPHTRWRTRMYSEAGMLVSEQWEGEFVHERWWFEPGRGMVRVEPLDLGNGKPADSRLVMTRVA